MATDILRDRPIPPYIIADRRDLLGGRLVPMLNGLRLARLLGSKFVMTWYSKGQDFHKLVDNIDELFTGELIEPFDESTGRGTIIPIESQLLANSVEELRLRGRLEPEDVHYGNLHAMPIFSKQLGVGYALRQQFPAYSLQETETLAEAHRELRREFDNIPKTKPIVDAIFKLDEYFRRHRSSDDVSVHIRRLHITSETILRSNRFNSYLSTSHCRSLVQHLVLGSDSGLILLASDNFRLVEELRKYGAGRVRSLDDVLDVTSLTPFQRALIDMYFLSFGKQLYGPFSAFGRVASILSNSAYVNVQKFVAFKQLAGNDITGSIQYHYTRREIANNRPIEPIIAKVGQSGLALALAERQAQSESSDDFAFELALQALAMLATETAQSVVALDYKNYVSALDACMRKVQDVELSEAVKQLLVAIDCRALGHGPARRNNAPTTRSWRLVALIETTLAMDFASDVGDHLAAIEHYRTAEERCIDVDINPRGLHLRAAESFRKLNQPQDVMFALRRALQVDGNFADSHFRLGLALADWAGLEDALREFRLAIDLEPDLAQYWRVLGRTLMKARQQSEGVYCLLQALHCEPQNESIAKELAQARSETGQA